MLSKFYKSLYDAHPAYATTEIQYKGDGVSLENIELPKEYVCTRYLGSGGYAVVVEAHVNGEKLAVKKLKNVMSNCDFTAQTLRELKI